MAQDSEKRFPQYDIGTKVKLIMSDDNIKEPIKGYITNQTEAEIKLAKEPPEWFKLLNSGMKVWIPLEVKTYGLDDKIASIEAVN